MTDEKLVELSIQNSNFFGEIIDRYKAPLERYIRRKSLFNEDEIEDMLQDVFISVYLNLNDYDKRFKFSSWIYRICHNKLISHYRKENIRSTVSLDREDNIHLLDVLFKDKSLDKQFDDKLMTERIRIAIFEMDRKYKDILLLSIFEEKSYDEIADILKLPLGTVSVYLKRGKEILKKKVDKYVK